MGVVFCRRQVARNSLDALRLLRGISVSEHTNAPSVHGEHNKPYKIVLKPCSADRILLPYSEKLDDESINQGIRELEHKR